MGYIERSLPRALAALGVDVHVIAADLQAYHDDPNYSVTYEPFNGPAIQPCGTESFDGYTLHRLPHSKPLGYVSIDGLGHKLRELRPDVVQTFAAASWIPLAAAISKVTLGYELFTGAHQTASVMSRSLMHASRLSAERIRSDIRRAAPGRLVGLATTKCYAATTDCAEVAVRFYGVPEHKIVILPLGVDTDIFRPALRPGDAEERCRFRESLGTGTDELVCVYTGRFSVDKNPLCLARAIATLRRSGLPFRGWFFGNGPQSADIQAEAGCSVHPFVHHSALPEVYRAANIGVWPTQESISMLDAAGCGLPVVVSDRLQARERVDGNGLTYKEGNSDDLARVLRQLSDNQLRARLGSAGAEKISARFSWVENARRRLQDYARSVGAKTVARSDGANA